MQPSIGSVSVLLASCQNFPQGRSVSSGVAQPRMWLLKCASYFMNSGPLLPTYFTTEGLLIHLAQKQQLLYLSREVCRHRKVIASEPDGHVRAASYYDPPSLDEVKTSTKVLSARAATIQVISRATLLQRLQDAHDAEFFN